MAASLSADQNQNPFPEKVRMIAYNEGFGSHQKNNRCAQGGRT
jgi:hypothetical protein